MSSAGKDIYPAKRTSFAGRHASRISIWLFITVVGYVVVVPLVRLQMLAFADGAVAYRGVYGDAGSGRLILDTLVLAVGSLLVALVLGTVLAWAASRLPRRWRFMGVLPLLPIVVPAVANITGWAFLLSPGPGYLNSSLRQLPWWSHLEEGPANVYSMPWIVIITGLSLTSFIYLFVNAGFQNINSEQVEASQVAGAGPFKTFLTIVLPLLRPQLVYGAGVALLLGLGQFTAPLLLGRNAAIDVITTEMYVNVASYPIRYDVAAALGSPLMVFGIIVVLWQKAMLGNQSRFVTNTGKTFRHEGRTSRLAIVGIAFYALFAAVMPLCALFLVAISQFWTGDLRSVQWTLDNFRTVAADANVKVAVANSLTYSVGAMLACLPVAYICACVLLRGQRFRLARVILDLIIAIPLGIPAVIFGAGFLFAYTQRPLILYGTPWVMILVYVTLMLPFATRMLLSGMIALGESLVEASRVSGAGNIRTHFLILFPLMRSSVAGAAAIIFVLLTHEFSASLLVRAPGTQVMGTVLFDYWTNGLYPVVAAVAVIMSLITAAGVTLAMLVGGSRSLGSL